MLAVKQLLADDWQSYSQLRLDALHEHPGLFGASYADENKFDVHKWRAWPDKEKCAIFGVFSANVLVAQAGIMQDRNHADSGFMIAAYVKPEYRGNKLSHLLYEHRIKWAQHQKAWKRLCLGHRAGNEAVQHMALKYGFKEAERLTHAWPDGIVDDLIIYHRDL